MPSKTPTAEETPGCKPSVWIIVLAVLGAVFILIFTIKLIQMMVGTPREHAPPLKADADRPDGSPHQNPFTVANLKDAVRMRVSVVDATGNAETLPAADVPLARFLQVTLPDAPQQRMINPSVFVHARTSHNTINSLEPAFIDLGAVVPIQEVEIFTTSRDQWVPDCMVRFLDADRKEVTPAEFVPRFFDSVRVNLTLPRPYRPVVWDAQAAVLMSTVPSSGVYNDRWFPSGAPHALVFGRSPRGLVYKREVAEVHVDRLTMMPPKDAPAVSLLRCPVFLALRLPRVTEPAVLLTFTGDDDVRISLGCAANGQLLYAVRAPNKNRQTVLAATSNDAPLGDPVRTEEPVVIGLQFTVQETVQSLQCRIVHPNGRIYTLESDEAVPPPLVKTATLWGHPTHATAIADPDRTLVVHEVCAYPYIPTPLTDRQLQGLHAGLVAKWRVAST